MKVADADGCRHLTRHEFGSHRPALSACSKNISILDRRCACAYTDEPQRLSALSSHSRQRRKNAAKWPASSARRGTPKLQFTEEREAHEPKHAHVENLLAYTPKEKGGPPLPNPAIFAALRCKQAATFRLPPCGLTHKQASVQCPKTQDFSILFFFFFYLWSF